MVRLRALGWTARWLRTAGRAELDDQPWEERNHTRQTGVLLMVSMGVAVCAAPLGAEAHSGDDAASTWIRLGAGQGRTPLDRGC